MAVVMASLTRRLLLLQLVILSVSTISTQARPCKTLLISSYSFSFRQNPSSPGFVTVFTEISRINHRPDFQRSSSSKIFLFPFNDEAQDRPIEPNELPFGLGLRNSMTSSSSYDFSSLRDRTKDIVGVVVALLFGVGCGALTAATMYLAWSLFSNRFYDYRCGSPDSDDDGGDDDLSPKKMGYVKIPAADSVLAPAKEVV